MQSPDLLLLLFSLTYSTGSGTSRPVPVPPTEHEFAGDCLVLRNRILDINPRIFGLEQELRRNKRKCYMVATSQLSETLPENDKRQVSIALYPVVVGAQSPSARSLRHIISSLVKLADSSVFGACISNFSL